MAKTIGNPISWAAQNIGATGDHIAESVNHIGSADTRHLPEVQNLTMQDLRACLQAGYNDFLETRADAIFIVLIYPIAGLLMFGFGLNRNMVPLLAPLIMGVTDGFTVLSLPAAVYGITMYFVVAPFVIWYRRF